MCSSGYHVQAFRRVMFSDKTDIISVENSRHLIEKGYKTLMTSKIYVAGPLFNTHERQYLEQIASALEAAGYTTFLPHRDAGLLGDISDNRVRERIFRNDMQALEDCAMVVALLTGADHDSGTCGELGYAYAKGKACIGITDDPRSMNNLIWGLCNEGRHIVATIDALLDLLRDQFPAE